METDTMQKVINACYQFFDYRTYESKQFDSLTVVGKIYNESNVNHTAKPILPIGGPQEPYSSWCNVIANANPPFRLSLPLLWVCCNSMDFRVLI